MYVYGCVFVSMYVYIYECVHVHICVWVSVCTYMLYIYVCVRVCRWTDVSGLDEHGLSYPMASSCSCGFVEEVYGKTLPSSWCMYVLDWFGRWEDSSTEFKVMVECACVFMIFFYSKD